MTDKQIRLGLVAMACLILVMGFFLFFLIVFSGDAQFTVWNLLVFLCVFLVYVGCAVFLAWDNAVIFAQRFYDLTREETRTLLMRLLGVVEGPLSGPVLRVQDGRANPDGPAVLFKVGGPGFLSIAHNSAAVTSRVGRLHRVLGPGFHHLEPFERCWDVIDLRPQHRTLRVEFMTLDGIPAYCNAEIRFRVAGSSSSTASSIQSDPMPSQPYPFDPEAVLKLATNKYVKSSEGSGRIADWCVGLVNGALDGELRDHLEKFSLDDFLNPDYREASYRYAVGKAVVPPKKPLELKDIEAEIEAKTKATGKQRGIDVEWVRLEPVRPVEAMISRQWLEFWQAKSRREIDEYAIDEDARRAQLMDEAKIEAQIELVTSVLNEVHALTQKGINVPSQLITLSFVDALRAMSDRDPSVRMLMFQQVESLERLVNTTQRNIPPAGTPSSPQPLPAP